METRATGTVAWFDPEKGYGFISRDNQAGDVFVHSSGIRSQEPYRMLLEGQRVEFSIVMGNKGPRAEDVVVVVAEPRKTEALSEEA